MDKILPRVKIENLQYNSIVEKIIPIKITYTPTTYKKVRSSIIMHIIGLIKPILSAIKFIKNIWKKFSRGTKRKFKKALKFFKKITKFIFRIITKIGRIIGKFFKYAFKFSKIILKSIKNIFKFAWKSTKFIIKLIYNIIKYTIKATKFVVRSAFKLVKITSKFIYGVIRKTWRIIKLMSKARKRLGFKRGTTKVLKLTHGRVKHSPPTLKDSFKELGKHTKDAGSKVFSNAKAGTKTSIMSKLKNMVKPIVNSIWYVVRWFKVMGKRVLRSSIFRNKFLSVLGKVISKVGKKLIATLMGTFVNTVAICSGIGAWLGILGMGIMWLAGIGLDLKLVPGAVTWKHLLTSILENMPYLGLIMTIDNVLHELFETDLRLFRPGFRFLQSTFGLKDEELNDNIAGDDAKTDKNKDPNLFILENINDIKQVNIQRYNMFNILDELYNDNNMGILNVINNKIGNFYKILDNRNKYIAQLCA